MAQTTAKDEKGNRSAFWRRHVTRWHRSGLPVRAYCAREGLSAWSFYAWRRRLAKTDRGAVEQVLPSEGEPLACGGADVASSPMAGAVAFVEVVRGAVLPRGAEASARLDKGSVGAGYVEVRVSRERGVRVWPGFDGETLRRVLAVLEGGSC